jgi:hypothetical protein
MADVDYIVQDTQTGKKFVWGLRRVLKEINRDRSENWTNYNKTDWTEGWSQWVDGYKIVGFIRNK